MARGRFTSAYPERMMLVDAVREITRHVDPEHPETVSAPAFDAARVEAGHPDCPTAKQCAARLGRPWSKLRAQASDPGTHWPHQLMRRPETGFTGTATEIAHQVRRIHAGVAAGLGQDPADHILRELDWRAEVELLNRRRHRRNPMACHPSFDQVIYAFGGSLDELLDAHHLPTKPTEMPRSISVFEALDRFLETFGAMPRRDEFERFRQAGRLRVAAFAGDWVDICLQWRAIRAARRLWSPVDAPLKADRPDYTLPDDFSHGDSSISSRQPTQEACIESAMDFLSTLGGQPATDVTYRQWSVGHDDRRSVNSLKNSRLGFHGTLAAARQRMRHGGLPEHPVYATLDGADSNLARAVLALLVVDGPGSPIELAIALLANNSAARSVLGRLADAGAVVQIDRVGGDRTERLRYGVADGLPEDLAEELRRERDDLVVELRAYGTSKRRQLHEKSKVVLAAVRELDTGAGVRARDIEHHTGLAFQHVSNHCRRLTELGLVARNKAAITGERWREVWVYSVADDAEQLLAEHQ